MEEFENSKEGYLVAMFPVNQFPLPTQKFIEDAASYVKENFPEILARLEKNSKNEGLDDWAAQDLHRTLAAHYKGLDVRTTMRLTATVREFLHPCGLDWSKLDFSNKRAKNEPNK